MTEKTEHPWTHWKCPICQTEFAGRGFCARCPKCGSFTLWTVAFLSDSEVEQRFEKAKKVTET